MEIHKKSAPRVNDDSRFAEKSNEMNERGTGVGKVGFMGYAI